MVERPDVAIRAIRVAGTDVTAEGVEVKGAATVANVEIEVARDFAAVGGVVRQRNGEPAPEAFVVAVPVDERRTHPHPWSDGTSRNVSREGGRYMLGGLAPGTYDVFAVRESEGYLDEEQLEALRGRGTRVTLGESQHVTLDLVVLRP